MSKKPTGNDISSLWQALLMNIKSPSTTALLKLATPLQIAPEGITLTFKNERLVAQISDNNKKNLIVEAANIMFNQENTPVTIRLAQSSDKVIQPTVSPVAKVEASTQQINEPKKTEEMLSQKIEKEEVVKSSKSNEDETKSQKRLETDQEKMVLDLFDGKYVD